MKSTDAIQVLDVIESSGLEQSTITTLKERFLPFYEQVETWKERAATLKVTDASQTREMKMAREASLALRAIRVEADKTRKALKEDSIRYGRAVQGVYNVIEYLIKPIEEHLQVQEDFVKIQEAKLREKLNDARAAIEAEARKKAQAEAEEQARKEEEARKLAAGPDKTKLQNFVVKITKLLYSIPETNTAQGGEIAGIAQDALSDLIIELEGYIDAM